MQQILEEMKSSYESSDNTGTKFALLNNIILLKSENIQDRVSIYRDIKKWLELYLSVVREKNFTYDEILFKKVVDKIELVPLQQRIHLISYFIRLLNKEFLNEEIPKYEDYKKEIVIQILRTESKYFSYCLKVSTKNLENLLITLIVSVIIFSLIWMEVDKYFPSILSINIIEFSKYELINYSLNIINIIFNSATLPIVNVCELVFMILLKLYFYIFITYFVIKEIASRVNKL